MSDWDKLMEPAREALEALIAEGDAMADRVDALTEQLAAARRDAEEAEAYVGELEADRKKTYEALLKVTRIYDEVEAKLAECEARLGKAVEALETIVANGGAGSYHLARATLAELTGGKDE